jgi:hypothetical protein
LGAAGGEAAESAWGAKEEGRKSAAEPRRQTSQKGRLESRPFRSLADLAGVGARHARSPGCDQNRNPTITLNVRGSP